MAFERDVARIPGLELAYREGLQALRREHRKRIDHAGASLRGSVDIDSSLRATAPGEPRWDYVVASIPANRGGERLHLIEFHPATSGANIKEVRTKHAWLRVWLQESAWPLAIYPKDIVWIASGRCAYNAQTPVIKKLASEGIRFAGSRFRIPR